MIPILPPCINTPCFTNISGGTEWYRCTATGSLCFSGQTVLQYKYSWCAIPRGRCTSPTFVGNATLCIAKTLFGSGQILSLLMTSPRNVTYFCKNWHFSMQYHTCILEVVENLVKAFIMFLFGLPWTKYHWSCRQPHVVSQISAALKVLRSTGDQSQIVVGGSKSAQTGQWRWWAMPTQESGVFPKIQSWQLAW